MKKEVDNEFIKCVIIEEANNIINIECSVKNSSNYKNMAIMAPNPIDRITSFSGKALPFPCEMIAFENTPNFKLIDKNGNVNVKFQYPNSYYTPDGYKKIISPVIISLDDKKIIIELEDKCPLKTLRDRKRNDPNFYGIKEFTLPIGTGEEVMNYYSKAKVLYNIA
jgi:hypothetical protein